MVLVPMNQIVNTGIHIESAFISRGMGLANGEISVASGTPLDLMDLLFPVVLILLLF